MDQITICDLEVFYRVGVPDEERSKPQRLLLTVKMDLHLRAASAADDLSKTINYDAVCKRLLHFGDQREWQLIETLAEQIAGMILQEFKAEAVGVEVKKFIIPHARYIAVSNRRSREHTAQTASSST